MVDRIGRVGRDATVMAVSAETGAGLAALGDHLGTGRTVGLVGSSGVGKSSLVNRFLGREALATAPIDGDGRGRHTTTRRELVPLPSGGVLVDTPGMRELGLVQDEGGLDASFADVAGAAARVASATARTRASRAARWRPPRRRASSIPPGWPAIASSSARWPPASDGRIRGRDKRSVGAGARSRARCAPARSWSHGVAADPRGRGGEPGHRGSSVGPPPHKLVKELEGLVNDSGG